MVSWVSKYSNVFACDQFALDPFNFIANPKLPYITACPKKQTLIASKSIAGDLFP
jgi:hypothetical protein